MKNLFDGTFYGNLLNRDVSTEMHFQPFFNVNESIYEQFGLNIKDFNLSKYINKYGCSNIFSFFFLLLVKNENRIFASQTMDITKQNWTEGSLIIGHLFWVPQTKNKLHWWKLLYVILFYIGPILLVKYNDTDNNGRFLFFFFLKQHNSSWVQNVTRHSSVGNKLIEFENNVWSHIKYYIFILRFICSF